MNTFLESFNDPHARHAMLVHAPITLSALGILPVLVWLATRMKSRALLGVAAAMFAIASVGAYLAAEAGEAAESNVGPMTAQAAAALERHEELGENGWMWPLIPMAFLGLAAAFAKPRFKALRAIAGAGALLGAGGVAGWVTITAHEGGRLVYFHGVGVPQIWMDPGASPETTPAPDGGDDD